MTSWTLSVILVLLFFIAIAEAGKKKSDKIVIEVPYKIHKHHHTHTKYKIITVPAKKERTIIYYKPIPTEKKSEISYVPVPIPTEKKPEMSFTGFQHYSPQHMEMEMKKPRQPKSFKPPPKQPLGGFIPSMMKKPEKKPQMVHFQMDNLWDQHFAPALHTPAFFPTFLPDLSHAGFMPKVLFPMIPPTPKFNLFEDSMAHGSSQVVNTVVTPAPSVTPSYSVSEPSQEVVSTPTTEYMTNFENPFLKDSARPSLKPQGNPNVLVPEGTREKFKASLIEEPYDYEHIGYLVIDGQTRKIVDKNFKEEFHLKE